MPCPCGVHVWPQKVSKFVLFSGERTTTVGTPSNLGEGNRELRAMLRNLSRPRDLVNVLALGQGLTDLLDLDGVLMSAADPSVSCCACALFWCALTGSVGARAGGGTGFESWCADYCSRARGRLREPAVCFAIVC